jgi:hypothetical protein
MIVAMLVVMIGFFERDEIPGQDRIQLVDAVRHGCKQFQLLSPFFPCLHDCFHVHALIVGQVPQFMTVIDSCRTEAMDTQTKYGTWATATHL